MQKAWGHPSTKKDDPKKDNDKGKDKEDDDGFQNTNKVVSVIFEGVSVTESKREKKLHLREIMAVEPPTPTYLK
jgi:hypothetical protein